MPIIRKKWIPMKKFFNLYFGNLNIVYIHVLYPYLDIVIVEMSNSQDIIFHICMDSKYKRRKKEKYKC